MALATAFVTSCGSDSVADVSQPSSGSEKAKDLVLTATMESNQVGTRVGMSKGENNTATFYWHKGDKIAVQAKASGSDAYSTVPFVTSTDDGSTSATFSSSTAILASKDYAAYPYAFATFSEENNAQTLTYQLPETYTYSQVESNIFSKTTDGDTTYPVNQTPMPMFGTISSGIIEFKHVGGLAVIRVDNMPTAAGTLTVTADQKLSGSFTVADLSASTTPEINTTTTDTESEKKVTFTFSGATKNGVGVFYLPLATGDYTNVKIALNATEEKNNYVMNYGSLSITRARVRAIEVKHWFVDLGRRFLWKEKLTIILTTGKASRCCCP